MKEHPSVGDMPHEGFCSWQFEKMLEGGKAICFETDEVPFNPIIEVASTHKYVIRDEVNFVHYSILRNFLGVTPKCFLK